MGIAFLAFFSVTHKIGLFSPKITSKNREHSLFNYIMNMVHHSIIRANASFKGFEWNKTKPQWPTHRNTIIDVGVLGCGPIWAGEGAAGPFNGVHLLGEIRPAGGLIPWPNHDGRT